MSRIKRKSKSREEDCALAGGAGFLGIGVWADETSVASAGKSKENYAAMA